MIATADLKEKISQLQASEAKNRAFIEVFPDLFFTLDAEGRFIDYSTVKSNLLAIPPEQFLGKRIDETGFSPELAARFMAEMKKAFETSKATSFEYELAFESTPTFYEGRIVPLSSDRILFVVRDISERRHSEDMIRISLREKEVLLKEIHHRVKNNMQVISSLIQLQSYAIHDSKDRELLRETQTRIHAMAAVHELLYQAKDLSSVQASEYLGSIVGELILGYEVKNLSFNAEEINLDLDIAVPLGLLLNELLLNSIKHAYEPGASGPMRVSIYREGGAMVLVVEDEGKGLPDGFNPETCTSMGFTLIFSLASQLHGTLTFRSRPGLTVKLRFKPTRSAVERMV